MAFNQDVKALRLKSGIKSEFLPDLLLGRKQRHLSLVDLAGHGTGRLNTDELKNLSVLVPPESEQHAIAHILGTLDDKIELNRRMNETLKAMARRLQVVVRRLRPRPRQGRGPRPWPTQAPRRPVPGFFRGLGVGGNSEGVDCWDCCR